MKFLVIQQKSGAMSTQDYYLLANTCTTTKTNNFTVTRNFEMILQNNNNKKSPTGVQQKVCHFYRSWSPQTKILQKLKFHWQQGLNFK